LFGYASGLSTEIIIIINNYVRGVGGAKKNSEVKVTN
jgi:hypothetical protein